MADLRVGIIGVGWGSLVLAPAFAATAGYQVAALCSRSADRVRQAGTALGVSDVTTDWRQLIARSDLDLIAVCTPTGLHAEQTIAALRAGKHVLCEKPVATTAAKAEQMYQAAQQSGLVNGVNFEGRWLRERLPVWDQVRAGLLGTPYLARVTTDADGPGRRFGRCR